MQVNYNKRQSMKRGRKYTISIIGKKPFTGRNRMGMGGVGVHVVRLTDWLDAEGVNYVFYDLSLFKLFQFSKCINNSSYSHLHSSSPYMRLLFAIVCKLLGTVSICTYHGDLGRFGRIKNLFDYFSIRMMDYPVVINEISYKRSIERNKNTKLISAYIPSLKQEPLAPNLEQRISTFCKDHEIVMATNAFAMNNDKNGEEIYGIIPLVKYVENQPQIGLIVSDSSGNYFDYFKSSCPSNVLIINEPHPFVGVLNYADIFIRYTTTDGDSLSIHEALDKGVFVIATNVVSRPNGCRLVNRDNLQELSMVIDDYKGTPKNCRKNENKAKAEIFDFYKDLVFSEEK